MAINYKIPYYDYKLPWFMYDLYNNQLITSVTVPGDISDNKKINLSEVQIPGENFAPITHSGNGNRKISFTIPLLMRNNTVGNSFLLKQLEALRNRAVGFTNVTSKQFTPNPKVLFYWGVGCVPLVWYVANVDFLHKQQWTNQQGYPQYTDAKIELWLDETHPTYQAEEMFRKVSLIAGSILNPVDNIFNPGKGRRF